MTPANVATSHPFHVLNTFQRSLIILILCIYALAGMFIGLHYMRMFRRQFRRPQTNVLSDRNHGNGRTPHLVSEFFTYVTDRTTTSTSTPLAVSPDHTSIHTCSALEAQVVQPVRRSHLSRFGYRPGWVSVGEVDKGTIAQRRRASLRA